MFRCFFLGHTSTFVSSILPCFDFQLSAGCLVYWLLCICDMWPGEFSRCHSCLEGRCSKLKGHRTVEPSISTAGAWMVPVRAACLVSFVSLDGRKLILSECVCCSLHGVFRPCQTSARRYQLRTRVGKLHETRCR